MTICRNTLSVGWDGRLFDCDFNQTLNLEVGNECPSNIEDFNYASLSRREIVVGQHCYGCAAGAGSGCQGAISLCASSATAAPAATTTHSSTTKSNLFTGGFFSVGGVLDRCGLGGRRGGPLEIVELYVGRLVVDDG